MRYHRVNLEKVIYRDTSGGFKKSKVSFCETSGGFKENLGHFGGIFFFVTWFQAPKIAVFWPKFTISGVSCQTSLAAIDNQTSSNQNR